MINNKIMIKINNNMTIINSNKISTKTKTLSINNSNTTTTKDMITISSKNTTTLIITRMILIIRINSSRMEANMGIRQIRNSIRTIIINIERRTMINSYSFIIHLHNYNS